MYIRRMQFAPDRTGKGTVFIPEKKLSCCCLPVNGCPDGNIQGFDGVEFYGNHFEKDFYCHLLKESDLICAGWHTPIEDLEDGKFESTVERNLAVNNKYICIPYFNAPDIDSWKRFADRLNLVAEKLRPLGIRTGFHCHPHEFQAIDGQLPWYIVAENTSSDVILQLDTGNALAGGGNILEALERFPGRNQTIHWKPYSRKDEFAVAVGKDDQDWKKIYSWCQTTGDTQWIILEYESKDKDAGKNIQESLAYIKNLQ